MKKEDFVNFCKRKNMNKDKYGHYKRVYKDGAIMRSKIKEKVVRSELKYKGSKTWYKRWSAYYKNISLSENDKLQVIKYN